LNGTGAGNEDNAVLAQPISNPFDVQGFSVSLTPEPGSLALAGLGGLGLLLRRRRK